MARFILGPAAGTIPELKHCRTDFELTEAAARVKMTVPTLRDIAPVLVFIPGILLLVVLFRLWRPYWMPDWALVPCIMVVAFSFALVMTRWTAAAGRRRVRAYLLSRGVPLCQSCGYDLRGLESPTANTPCPECGVAMGARCAHAINHASDDPAASRASGVP
jgi:predicted RNA-binding Zn-ribbon protein involved in translation (DUF1610 family)